MLCFGGAMFASEKEGKEQDEYVSKFYEFDVSYILRISIRDRKFVIR
jgi:hypothetical protein